MSLDPVVNEEEFVVSNFFTTEFGISHQAYYYGVFVCYIKVDYHYFGPWFRKSPEKINEQYKAKIIDAKKMALAGRGEL